MKHHRHQIAKASAVAGRALDKSFHPVDRHTASSLAVLLLAGPRQGAWTADPDLLIGVDGNGGGGGIGGGRSSTLLALVFSLAAGSVMAQATAFIDNATVTVPGTYTSPWNHPSNLLIGFNATGALVIEDGGSVSNVSGTIGLGPGSVGTVTVTGAGSSWTNSYRLVVGQAGAGTLNIEDGGSVSSIYTRIANGAGGGTLNLNGSVGMRGVLATGYINRGGPVAFNWNGGILRALGNEANFLQDFTAADIKIGSDGAFFDSNSYDIGIRTDLSGTGGLTKLGAGSLTLTGTSNYGGNTTVSAGTLAIGNGGSVRNANGYIGNDTGDTGTMTVTGTGSKWINSNEVIVGIDGTGTLNIEEGGSVSNTVGSIGANNGSIGTATVTGTDSSWTNSSSLYVGFGGSGTLIVKDGGLVGNVDGAIGTNNGSTGAVTVTDAGSSWTNSNVLSVGLSGTGTLNIENGGSVSNNTGYIGAVADGTGTVIVTGIDSNWKNADFLMVGDSGSGTLNIKDGGSVSNANGNIGHQGGGTGMVTVTGNGSSWENAELIVGDSGSGTLNIKDGGLVSNGVGAIGVSGGGTGAVTVTDTGSSWKNSGSLYVGDSGIATLAIENGGSVSNTYATIGANNGSTGTVTVTGTGSSWINSRDIYVGDGGNGILNIEGGGLVNTMFTTLGAGGGSGTLNLNGAGSLRGALETAYVQKGPGTGTFNWNGGILRATADGSSLLRGFATGGIALGAGGALIDTQAFTVEIDNQANILAGVGGLTKQGSGTLSIAGRNSYAGNTTVSAGTLRFDTYNQSSSQILGIGASDASTFGKLAVTGAATFAADSRITVDVASVNALAKGQILTGVVTAGSLNASTFNVTDNSALFNFNARVNGNAVDMKIVANSTSGVYDAVTGSGTSSALGAARVLDTFVNGFPTGDLGTVVTALGQLQSDREVSGAAAQTLPLLSGGITQSTLDMLGSFHRIVQNRLGNNAADSNASGLSGGNDFANRQAWTRAFGSRADQDDGNGASGFSANSWGTAFGIDGELDRDTRIGVTYAYANSSVDGNTGLSGAKQSANVDSHVFGVYGNRSLQKNLQLNWQADIGRNGVDGTRHIDFGGLNRTASSSYASYSAHVGTGLSKEYALDAVTTIMPGIRADYTWLRDQSYRESGADALNLNVDGNTTEAFVITAEGRIRHALSARGWLTTNLGVGYDVINDRSNIVSAYAGAPGQSFATPGIDHSPWMISGGIGYTMQVHQGSQISLRYDAEGRDDYLNQTASVKANWQF